jgi:hypothetical protein
MKKKRKGKKRKKEEPLSLSLSLSVSLCPVSDFRTAAVPPYRLISGTPHRRRIAGDESFPQFSRDKAFIESDKV